MVPQGRKEMAENEWINGYLEAILDAGSNKRPFSCSSPKEAEAVASPTSLYSPTKYFVEEVVNRFDDADLHKTWIKAVAIRNSQLRNRRLENMCWRIWHLVRKKKQIEWEDAKSLAKRRLALEQGSKEAAEDLSELSEGEKEKGESNHAATDSPKDSGISRINSDMKTWLSDEDGEPKRLYIVLISLHGLVRGENMELGRDPDTGGQVKYVVELARALAATKGVYRVDLLTRQISSPDVHWTYGEPVEMITASPNDTDQITADGDSCGAYIIRLPCGPRDRYVPKESLWPYIPEFVDRALAHITNVARSLGEQQQHQAETQPAWPHVIHGHYADAAEAAARLSGLLNVPMVMTGHSLGRNKLEQLLKQGRLGRADINSAYRIARRIEAEERGLDAAEMVVASTRQEVEEQWGLYDGFDPRLERKLRARRRRGVSCLGRHMPRMVVIPPGMDFSYVNTPELAEVDGDLSSFFGSDRSQSKRHLPPIWTEIMRFLTNPHKPMILALSRPDPKKNVTTLLKAFGECRQLRELANMTLILGNRDDIEEMADSSTAVLTAVLKLIDRYDLYGQVAYPKHHQQCDVPQIYRLAAKTKGVFVNPALVEPFGLTLIEASAYGLPVVATRNGGPIDILKALNNGILVDPHDHNAISEALLKLVADKSLWLDCRKSGLKNIHCFSWPQHCRNYLSHLEHCRLRHPTTGFNPIMQAVDEPVSDSLRDIDDLSIKFSADGGEAKPNGSDVSAFIEALRRHRPENPHDIAECNVGYGPGRRQRLFVVAVDCYDPDGRTVIDGLTGVVGRVMAAGGHSGGRTGFVFSTGLAADEAVEALRRCGVDAGEFDALICRSGSEIYYPWRDVVVDADYGAHVEYRWAGEHLRSTVLRLSKVDGAAEDDDLAVDEMACSTHCHAYSLKPGAKAPKMDAIHQRLRMRGFRCSLAYTRACTRLNVIPLFASRALALRYLSMRWGIDLLKVVVFVGDRGDTDHEDLLPGLHRTVIFKDLVSHGSERLLRDEESYKREDVVQLESPSIVSLTGSCDHAEISSVLEGTGMK